MSLHWYDTAFAARIDPGPDMMKWPTSMRDAVARAVLLLREQNPQLRRIVQVISHVDDKSEVVGYRYRIVISMLAEEHTLQ